MENSLQILITGDFYGGQRIEKLILKEEYQLIYNDFLPIIKRADIAITNLESAMTAETESIKKTGPSLKSSPKTIEAFKFAGFNLITLANNHILDFGKAGLTDTLNLLDGNDLSYIGAGMNIHEAEKIFRFSKNNVNISILNFAENEWSTTHGGEAGANPVNPVKNFQSIQKAKKKGDQVIVITHGGHEMYNMPSPRMKELFHFYVEAGADAIVNHHPHCISGYEIYKEAPIFYSIGNFIFDKSVLNHSQWNEGMAVQFQVSKKAIEFDIIHFDQNNENVGVRLCSNKEKQYRNEKLFELNKLISNDIHVEKSFLDWVSKQKKMYSSFIEPHQSRIIQALQNRKILPSLWSKRKKRFILNLIRCEAHRDVLQKILENDVSNS